MNKNLFIFRVKANKNVATGHLYNCINIFNNLVKNSYFKNSDIFWQLIECDQFAYDELKQFNAEIIKSIKDIKNFNIYKNKILINDTLNTSISELIPYKNLEFFIATFEDIGEGANIANIVLNGLYQKNTKNIKELNGPEYLFYREEFFEQKTKVANPKNHVLVTFGGYDPSFLTERVYEYLVDCNISFKILKPPHRKLKIAIPKNLLLTNDDIPSIAKVINDSYFLITSGGRTACEAWLLERTCISIAQNFRETLHYSVILPSVTYYGLESELNKKSFLETLELHINKIKGGVAFEKKTVLDVDSFLNSLI